MGRKVLLLLVAVITILAILVPGCAPAPRRYALTMAVAPAGAGTTTPSGTTFRTAGAVVNIQAVANPGYQFVN